jgi:hypothetical protein
VDMSSIGWIWVCSFVGLLHDETSVTQTANAIITVYDFEGIFITLPFFIDVLSYFLNW